MEVKTGFWTTFNSCLLPSGTFEWTQLAAKPKTVAAKGIYSSQIIGPRVKLLLQAKYAGDFRDNQEPKKPP